MTSLRYAAMTTFLLFTLSAAWSLLPANLSLPAGYFRGWAQLQNEKSAGHIMQVWRRPLNGLPKGSSGYLMLAYEAKRLDSPNAATTAARTLLQKQRFHDYIARGYTVTMDPWITQGQKGALFTIRGLSHTTDAVSAHRADIYTLSFTEQEWAVWMELRVATSANELELSDHAIKDANGAAQAADIADLILSLWMPGYETSAALQAEPTVPLVTEAPPTQSTTQPALQPIAETAPSSSTPPAATVPEQPAVQPPTGETVPAQSAAPQDTTTNPSTEQPVTPVAAPSTPDEPTVTALQSAEPAPVQTKPAESTVNTTPSPSTPEASQPRWQTADGTLSLVLPAGWQVTGKTPYVINGLPGVAIRVYPPESYRNDNELKHALQMFTATHRDISSRHFTQAECRIDEAVGMQVCYTNFDKRTSLLYLFGKSNRLWQFEIELPGDGAVIPEAITRLVDSIRVK